MPFIMRSSFSISFCVQHLLIRLSTALHFQLSNNERIGIGRKVLEMLDKRDKQDYFSGEMVRRRI
jgi:hypothetical protein